MNLIRLSSLFYAVSVMSSKKKKKKKITNFRQKIFHRP